MRYIRLTGVIGLFVALLLFLLIIVLIPVLIAASLAILVVVSVLSIPFLIAAKLRNRQKASKKTSHEQSRTIDAEYTIKKQD